ncbi:phage tail protein [Lysinibacillus pakistanensis]|uniref:Phage tail protein n=1 Tax=Lysinibacillus pakistanensis TaxID=759811 RepID=A0AAX3WU28_9BACI|nr:phage tail protein [Lysinibacillus pakistanensis]MDM5229638.1 phage tail protein [Lysinibacillus pakistanensis]WHY45244.1 phage tail protein [Lysinibacillus pakistanensis]WHY50253.1 phage tail protein [Lysinibacillus pakistanensis]
MIVTNLAGETELLTDYSGLKRVRKVNGDYSLSFAIIKTEKNVHAFPLVEEESIVEFDDQQYRIKDVKEVLAGVTPIKTVQATHIFFDLIDTQKYDYLKNTQHLQSCLTFALDGTDYTFEVIDSFSSAIFEKFGEDNSLSLVQKALNVFGAEVQINNKHLKFYRQIGTDTETQIRYGYNVKTLERYVNTNNLSTRIRGFGKKNENDSYVVTAEYLSPNHTIYGIRDAKPVYDERYTVHSELLDRIKSELIDEPQVSFKVDALELKKLGVLTEQLNEGDRVFVIYEPLGIDLIARVLEIVDYPESSKPAEYVFGNFQNNFVSEMAGFQKTKDNVDAILNGNQKLPYNVLDDAVLRATEALTSAMTELVFDNGIIARDPSNPNRLVLINSKGIGISDNGGATFKEAITADGFVLSAGAVGQLKANNIDVTGLIRGINDEGETTIDGGRITTNSIDVQKLMAGILTGFIIQTNENPYLPRIYMGGSKFEATNGDSTIIIDTMDWDGYAGFIVKSGAVDMRLQAYNDRTMLSSNGAPLEIWALNSGVKINGDFEVSGSKNATVPTSIGHVNVSAYETAEYFFGDIGRGKVVEGQCIVEIEPLFKETVNTEITYEVFLTPYGKGVIYADPDEMTADQFIVRGDDIPFAYEIKAKRKGYEDVRLELSQESEVEDIVQNASQN